MALSTAGVSRALLYAVGQQGLLQQAGTGTAAIQQIVALHEHLAPYLGR